VQLMESERQGIPHHLLDVADVTDDFSAGVFFHEARRMTAEVLQVVRFPDCDVCKQIKVTALRWTQQVLEHCRGAKRQSWWAARAFTCAGSYMGNPTRRLPTRRLQLQQKEN
jgi:IPP transferase